MQFKKLANQGWNGRRMTRRRRRREYPALSSTYVERILNFAAASIVSSAEWITSVITIDPVALPSPSRVNVSNYVWPGKERQLLISRCIYGSIRVSSKTRPSFQIYICRRTKFSKPYFSKNSSSTFGSVRSWEKMLHAYSSAMHDDRW